MTVTQQTVTPAPMPDLSAASASPAASPGLGDDVSGLEFAAGSQVVVVAGVLGNAGTTGVVAGVAGAALAGGLTARVIDSAPPRRSGLSQLIAAEGISVSGDGLQVVSSSKGGLQVQYVRAADRDGLDRRCDRPAVWEQAARPADVTAVDVGCPLEDVLRTGEGRCWLDPAVVGSRAWVVLVVPPTAGGLRRTDAVLQAWTPARLAAVAQVVVAGPGELRDTVRGQAGSLTRQALEMSIRQRWHTQMYGTDYDAGCLTGPLTDTGAPILAAMGGTAGQAVQDQVGRSHRGLTKWRRKQ